MKTSKKKSGKKPAAKSKKTAPREKTPRTLRRRAQDLFERAHALLFPPRCIFCDEILPVGARCESCEKRLEPLRLTGGARTKAGMGDKTLDALDEVAACYEYAEDVAETVIRYKFCGETGYHREMAAQMADVLRQTVDTGKIDLVVQVPAYRADDIHARLLAKRVARLLGVKFDAGALVKIAPTRKQHELGRAEREVNIRNAFDVPDRKRVQDKTVLICDDVVTSGSTLNECARTLRECGAKAVLGAAFASTFMSD